MGNVALVSNAAARSCSRSRDLEPTNDGAWFGINNAETLCLSQARERNGVERREARGPQRPLMRPQTGSTSPCDDAHSLVADDHIQDLSGIAIQSFVRGIVISCLREIAWFARMYASARAVTCRWRSLILSGAAGTMLPSPNIPRCSFVRPA